MQLHNPTSISSPSSPQPPLPIPQRTSSKFRVVLPIVRDRTVKEEALAEVAEVAEEVDEDSMDEEERTRREVAAFLARPPRKTVRQIRSAVTLRPGSSNDAHPPTPDHYHGEPSLTSQTPSWNLHRNHIVRLVVNRNALSNYDHRHRRHRLVIYHLQVRISLRVRR
jgi:hypothetical protein